jgi:intracellular multiplication protein IcmE
MAGKKENLKGLMTNTRSRIIILITVFLMLSLILIGYFKFKHPAEGSVGGGQFSAGPGSIRSIPGGANPTAQYALLQETQNLTQAEKAAKKGSSAIPTIVRSQAFGDGVEAVGPQGGKAPLGFTALTRENSLGPQQSLWLQQLKDSNCSQSVVKKVMSQGAGLNDLKSVCTCAQLKDDGYSLADLKNVCTCLQLKAAGYNATQLKGIGLTPERLIQCNFNPCELHAAGFSALQLKDAGLSDGELKGAGYLASEIARAGGLPSDVSEEDVRKAGCQPAALKKLQEKGVTAAAIRRISGCGIAQLKMAGFTPIDLKQAGFTPAELRQAGFTPAELKQAGFTAAELKQAGFTPDELKQAGFPATGGLSDAAIQAAGCDPTKLKALYNEGVSAEQTHDLNGCSVAALKAAGFNAGDLLKAGFTPKQLTAAGFTPADLSQAEFPANGGISDAAIQAAGCDPTKLKEVYKEGVSAEQIHALNGCSAAALKTAGFGAGDLLKGGFNPKQLMAAGFTPAELKAGEKSLADAGISDADIRAAGCDPEKIKMLHKKGISLKRIQAINNCSITALKAAGFGAGDLLKAGFTPQKLLAAGFTPSEVKAGQLSLAGISKPTNDCSITKLMADRAAGVSAETIRQKMGCSVSALKQAGYSAKQLKPAGFTAAELKGAGFNAADLKNAGFSPRELKAAGFDASQLKNAGFNANQLKNAGFDAPALKQAGINAEQLNAAGFGANSLKKAGFNAQQLKDAGYTKQELHDAGIEPKESALEALENATLNPSPPSNTSIPSLGDENKKANIALKNQQQLKSIMQRQKDQMASQQYQQKIQQKMGSMSGAANQALQGWKTGFNQVYIAGNPPKKKPEFEQSSESSGSLAATKGGELSTSSSNLIPPVIKAGDVLFAVLDTSVDSDQPGPVLATIVAGRFKDAKLIGSFNLPGNSDKMVISFNMMSVPGAVKTTSINAYAIDPNTARTALASRTDHHYLLRYGSLFASTFLEGFGNAFQSANTTVTIGGTGVASNTTISNGVGRSTMENAVIGLATLGKNWGQVAMQNMNTPTTVEVFGGLGLGILFTQDVEKI